MILKSTYFLQPEAVHTKDLQLKAGERMNVRCVLDTTARSVVLHHVTMRTETITAWTQSLALAASVQLRNWNASIHSNQLRMLLLRKIGHRYQSCDDANGHDKRVVSRDYKEILEQVISKTLVNYKEFVDRMRLSTPTSNQVALNSSVVTNRPQWSRQIHLGAPFISKSNCQL